MAIFENNDIKIQGTSLLVIQYKFLRMMDQLMMSKEPYSSYFVQVMEKNIASEEESVSSKNDGKLTIDVNVTQNVHPRQWQSCNSCYFPSYIQNQ